MSYQQRRQALKAHILDGLSIVVRSEAWESWEDTAYQLGLSEQALTAVCNEVSDELARRAVRLPGTDEALDNQARADYIAGRAPYDPHHGERRQ